MIQSVNWWVFAVLLPFAYWLSPARWRLPLLTVASLAVLALIDPVGIACMLALGLAIYGAFAAEASPAVARLPPLAVPARLGRWPGALVAVFLYLFVYKYLPAIARAFDHRTGLAGLGALAAPMGISYFTFKLGHYVIERRGRNIPPHTLVEFLTWLFLMPTFTAGPIERFEHFIEARQVHFKAEHIEVGLTRIGQGLVKKFVIQAALTWAAHRLAGDDVIAFARGTGGEPGAWAVWAYFALDFVILYLDFSAYSDIAIGAARLFGIVIQENFNYPLTSPSLAEFWRRWHMTLTNWCRVYIFMPLLGVTRNPYLATIATFFVIGLWHAAALQWIAWGLWNGLGLCVTVWWGRFANRRRIRVFKSGPGALAGWALTMIYITLGEGLLTTFPNGALIDSLRLMARAFNVVI